jgi:hypothetical protein
VLPLSEVGRRGPGPDGPGPDLAFSSTHRNVARTIRRIVVRNMTKGGDCSHGRFSEHPVTLFEVCCSTHSSFAKAVLKAGGAAIRVTWPPVDRIPEHLRRFVHHPLPSRAIQEVFLRRYRRVAPSSDHMNNRDRSWAINVDWPIHQRRLLQHVLAFRPARGTVSVVLHTSPKCNMFSCAQMLNVTTGRYNQHNHKVAMARLRFMRRLHAAWRRRRRLARIRGISLHEQPPKAKVDLRAASTSKGKLWPWAIGKRTRRSTVNGCVLGVKGETGLPLYKGWTFECDAPHVHRALRGFACSHDHVHERTILNDGLKAGDSPARIPRRQLMDVGALERYPNSLGSLLAGACGLQQ